MENNHTGLMGEVFLALFAVFFILTLKRTSPTAVNLDLVQVGQGTGLVRDTSPHLLEITSDGQCFLDGTPIQPNHLNNLRTEGRPVTFAYEFQDSAAAALKHLYDNHIPVYLAVEPTTSTENATP